MCTYIYIYIHILNNKCMCKNICLYLYIYIYTYTPKKLDERIPKIRVWTRQFFEIVTILEVYIYIYLPNFKGFISYIRGLRGYMAQKWRLALFRSHKKPTLFPCGVDFVAGEIHPSRWRESPRRKKTIKP